jgi:hypothetical protein
VHSLGIERAYRNKPQEDQNYEENYKA